jgi:hypothetical protein
MIDLDQLIERPVESTPSGTLKREKKNNKSRWRKTGI